MAYTVPIFISSLAKDGTFSLSVLSMRLFESPNIAIEQFTLYDFGFESSPEYQLWQLKFP
jgi:hypothetical protein